MRRRGYITLHVWKALRKVSLGIVVLIAASAVLLLSDLQHRQPATAKAAGHKWKIYFVQFNDVIDVEESADGVKQGLAEAGLRDGHDFEIKTLNAQGDMATVSALVDAAVTGGADLLITFSTPTLQAAMRRAHGVPVVYTYVASALMAGAGKSNTDHVPGVTGISMMAPYDDTLTIVTQVLPRARVVGTLYCPAETNMVAAKKVLDEVAKRRGFEVVYVTADTATDVPDAAAALVARNIDAILQIPGNLTASAFSGISEAGRRAHIPIFAFQKAQAIGGALVVVGRDPRDSGREAAKLAVRVMRGEDPSKIPLQDYDKIHLIVNRDAARAINITIPPRLLQSAQDVIGGPGGDR